MKKKIIIGLLSATLLFTLAGCGNETTGYVSGGTKDKSVTEEQVDIEDEDKDKDEQEIEKEEKIEDKDVAEDKDEIKDKEEMKVSEEEKEEEIETSKKTSQIIKVYYSDDQAMNLVEKEMDIKLAEGENLEVKILESLKVKPSDKNVFNAVEENIKFKSVKVEDKIAKVDLSSENLQGSSTQETFLVDSVVAALTSLDSVDGVKFLVDGKETDSLMGHIEASHVLTKDDIQSNIVK